MFNWLQNFIEFHPPHFEIPPLQVCSFAAPMQYYKYRSPFIIFLVHQKKISCPYYYSRPYVYCFFQNLPNPTFIPDPTFISDPRVCKNQIDMCGYPTKYK